MGENYALHYSQITDEELLGLRDQSVSLMDGARKALADELVRRGLANKSTATRSDGGANAKPTESRTWKERLGDDSATPLSLVLIAAFFTVRYMPDDYQRHGGRMLLWVAADVVILAFAYYWHRRVYR